MTVKVLSNIYIDIQEAAPGTLRMRFAARMCAPKTDGGYPHGVVVW